MNALMLSRRSRFAQLARVFSGLILWPLMAAAPALHAGSIKVVSDARAEARAAARDGVPLVLFFSSYSCPYCEIVSSLYLEPLAARGTGARIREVEASSEKGMRDFAGNKSTHAVFAAAQRVSVTPVVKFYGPDGSEIADPLIGYSNSDYYGEYLESSLREARARMR